MKEIYSITELVEIGYPKNMLREIARSDDFREIGFNTGRKSYFHKQKLDKYLERRTK